MQMRGVREVSPLTRSTVWRGYFANDPALRAEFLVAAGLQRSLNG
jgi:GTP cyclohydrolase I